MNELPSTFLLLLQIFADEVIDVEGWRLELAEGDQN